MPFRVVNHRAGDQKTPNATSTPWGAQGVGHTARVAGSRAWIAAVKLEVTGDPCRILRSGVACGCPIVRIQPPGPHVLEALGNVTLAAPQSHPFFAHRGPAHPSHGFSAVSGGAHPESWPPAHHSPALARFGPDDVGVVVHGAISSDQEQEPKLQGNRAQLGLRGESNTGVT